MRLPTWHMDAPRRRSFLVETCPTSMSAVGRAWRSLSGVANASNCHWQAASCRRNMRVYYPSSGVRSINSLIGSDFTGRVLKNTIDTVTLVVECEAATTRRKAVRLGPRVKRMAEGLSALDGSPR